MSAFKLQVNLNGSWRDVMPLEDLPAFDLDEACDAATVLVRAGGKPMRLVKGRDEVVGYCDPPGGEWRKKPGGGDKS